MAPDKKYGVWGDSKNGYGVIGTGDNCGVYGEAPNGFLGVVGRSDLGIGVDGISNSTEAAGVVGYNYNSNGTGVYAGSNEIGGTGVFAFSFYGVYAVGGWTGVFAQNHLYGSRAYLGAPSVAGDFYDDIYVHGRIRTDGGGFQIDHSLDASTKYLSHSFVSSPDMKNIYDGVVILDVNGKAEVDLPDWFETINKDFCYQLTPISTPGSNLYIEEEITKNHFKIAGGKHGMKVSWQVAGTRKGPWANANRVEVGICIFCLYDIVKGTR